MGSAFGFGPGDSKFTFSPLSTSIAMLNKGAPPIEYQLYGTKMDHSEEIHWRSEATHDLILSMQEQTQKINLQKLKLTYKQLVRKILHRKRY